MNTNISPSSQKYLLIGGVALGAILLVMTIWLSMARREMVKDERAGRSGSSESMERDEREDSDGDEDEKNPEQSLVEPDEQPATHTASRITFDAVALPQAPVNTPPSVSVHRFSTYDADDVNRMATALGLTQQKTEKGATIAYNTTDPRQRGWLMVDGKNGVLTYRFFGDEPQIAQGTTPSARAQSFLTNLGVVDESVDCSITYQKTAMPDVTMVECHRDWQKMGLPILNFIGLINAPEAVRLSAMKVGMVYEGAPDDPSVVNTSTNQDGQRRPDDFNTATVSVHSDGTILGFTSNIREISGTQQVLASNFVPVEEVRQKILRGQTEMFFIRPEGNNTVDWSAFFSTTTGRGAQITDLILAYVEIPGKQEYLAPMYIARGSAQLGNYRATFLAADPATKIAISAVTRSGAAVAGVSTDRRLLAQAPNYTDVDRSPKLSTFGFLPSATIDGTEMGECLPGPQHLYPLVDLPPVGKIGPWSIQSEGQKRAGNWYLIPSNPDVLPEINAVVALFEALNIQGKKAEVREMDNLQREWADYSKCPLRASGTSPTIFVYGRQGAGVQITPRSNLIYRKPVGGWNVVTQADRSMSVVGKTVEYLYYEYQPVAFTRPGQGWNVSRANVMTFAQQTIATQLGLTEEEGDRLAYEIARATFGMTDTTVYIAPIPQTEVDAKVPLDVTGTDMVVRAHFYVGGAQSGATAPSVTPVPRTQTMVLELGAAQGK